MSDQDRIILLTISIQYRPDKWWEQRKLSIWGWLVDPILNSLNQYYKNCMIDSKENFKFGLGVKGLTVHVNQLLKIGSLSLHVATNKAQFL